MISSCKSSNNFFFLFKYLVFFSFLNGGKCRRLIHATPSVTPCWFSTSFFSSFFPFVRSFPATWIRKRRRVPRSLKKTVITSCFSPTHKAKKKRLKFTFFFERKKKKLSAELLLSAESGLLAGCLSDFWEEKCARSSALLSWSSSLFYALWIGMNGGKEFAICWLESPPLFDAHSLLNWLNLFVLYHDLSFKHLRSLSLSLSVLFEIETRSRVNDAEDHHHLTQFLIPPHHEMISWEDFVCERHHTHAFHTPVTPHTVERHNGLFNYCAKSSNVKGDSSFVIFFSRGKEEKKNDGNSLIRLCDFPWSFPFYSFNSNLLKCLRRSFPVVQHVLGC